MKDVMGDRYAVRTKHGEVLLYAEHLPDRYSDDTNVTIVIMTPEMAINLAMNILQAAVIAGMEPEVREDDPNWVI